MPFVMARRPDWREAEVFTEKDSRRFDTTSRIRANQQYWTRGLSRLPNDLRKNSVSKINSDSGSGLEATLEVAVKGESGILSVIGILVRRAKPA
jgi:hypothetical protein